MVMLGRDREHALFSVESVGAISPQIIFKEACKVLAGKCDAFLEEINLLRNDLQNDVKMEE